MQPSRSADARAPYSSAPRAAPPPISPGKPLLVHLVLNLEVWAFDQPLPRKLLTSPHGHDAVPDLPNFSWVEYGMRAGLPRLVNELSARGLPASVSINAGVLDAYPGVAERLAELGWEFVGHGYRQRSLHAEEDERAVVSATLTRIGQLVGRPRGWLGPGIQETFAAPDILAELGIAYTLDWTIDDLPLWLRTTGAPLLAIPYTLELNDSVLWAAHEYASDELHRRVSATLRVFERELASSPRILTLGLHPHLVGVPHRFYHLCRTLDELQARTDAEFVTGERLYEWYSAWDRP
jgi:allantoinase